MTEMLLSEIRRTFGCALSQWLIFAETDRVQVAVAGIRVSASADSPFATS